MVRGYRLFSPAAPLATEEPAPSDPATGSARMTPLAAPDIGAIAAFAFDGVPADAPAAEGALQPAADAALRPAAEAALQPATDGAPQLAPMAAAPAAARDQALGPVPAEAPAGAPGPQDIVFIDPSATEAGDGSAANPFSSWLFGPLVAGTIYLQRAGTVLESPLVLRGEGTDTAPILIGSYGTGAPPVVRGSIVIEQSAHLILTGFTVEGSPYPAVIVRDGAHHITIAGNTIQDSGLGVWFGADSGGGNLVTGNTISGHATHGIAFDKADHRAEPSQVFDNVIRDNGSHGIELNGNGIVVSGNVVSGNGHLVSGSSGIHVYGGVGQADGFGVENVILGNTVTDTYESGQGLDGNGIQLDQFTARNTVMSNIVAGNDGAGIILYDSSSNLVRDNTLDGNALDRSGSRPWLAELMLATSPDVALDLTAGNVVTANGITPRTDGVTAIWLDTMTTDNANLIIDNPIATAAMGVARTALVEPALAATVVVETALAEPSVMAGLAGTALTLCDAPIGGGDGVWGA